MIYCEACAQKKQLNYPVWSIFWYKKCEICGNYTYVLNTELRTKEDLLKKENKE